MTERLSTRLGAETPTERAVKETVAYEPTFWTFSDERTVLTHIIRKIGNATPGPTLCGQDRFAMPPRGGAWSREAPAPVCPACSYALVGGALSEVL